MKLEIKNTQTGKTETQELPATFKEGSFLLPEYGPYEVTVDGSRVESTVERMGECARITIVIPERKESKKTKEKFDAAVN